MANVIYSGGDLPQLAGGINLKVSDYLREPGECLLIINAIGDRLGSLMKRPGYTLIGAALASSQDILGLQPYYQAGASKRLFGIVNGGSNATIHVSTGGAWTSINSSLLSDALYQGCQFLDTVFFVGYSSGSSTFATNFLMTGTSFSTSQANINGMPQGKFVCRAADLLYVGNARSGGTNYPSRIYFSSVPSSGVITWTSTNFVAVPEDNNEEISWLEESNNQLLIFKERSLYRWDESVLVKVADTGTPLPGRSVKTVGYYTFFYSQNGGGVYAYSGGKPKLISQKIQPLIDAITQTSLDDLRAEADYDHYYLFVGDVTIQLPYGDTMSVTNAVYVYTISTNSWYVYSLADSVKGMCRFVDDTNGFDRVYFGSTGEVFRLAYDVDSVSSDDGDSISGLIRYRTPIGAFHELKVVHKAYPLVDRAQGMTFRARADNRDWKRETQINQNAQMIPLDLEGRIFEFEITESSIFAPFILNGMAFIADQRTNSP